MENRISILGRKPICLVGVFVFDYVYFECSMFNTSGISIIKSWKLDFQNYFQLLHSLFLLATFQYFNRISIKRFNKTFLSPKTCISGNCHTILYKKKIRFIRQLPDKNYPFIDINYSIKFLKITSETKIKNTLSNDALDHGKQNKILFFKIKTKHRKWMNFIMNACIKEQYFYSFLYLCYCVSNRRKIAKTFHLRP